MAQYFLDGGICDSRRAGVECRSRNTDGVQAHGIICCGRGRIQLVGVHQRDYAIVGVRDDDDGDSLRTRCSFFASHFDPYRDEGTGA